MSIGGDRRYGCPVAPRIHRLIEPEPIEPEPIEPASEPGLDTSEPGAGRRSAFRRRVLGLSAAPAAIVLVVAAGFGPGAGASVAAAAGTGTGTKVVIVVGPVGSTTARYIQLADNAATAARRYTSNVTTIYSPYATWQAVSRAIEGANVVIYLGHGNGFPNPYSSVLRPTTQDGMGLNATSGAGNSNLAYVGEAQIGSSVHLAPNAVVLLNRLCYASGNSEWGRGIPALSVAKARVDNFAAGFIRAGARAVIADALGDISWYVDALFTRHSTIDALFRAAPDAHNHYVTFGSSRNVGFTDVMDVGTYSWVPDGDPYYRSMVSIPSLSTDLATGAAGPFRGVVTHDFVNLRSSPSAGARVLAKLQTGTPFTVVDDLVAEGAGAGRTWVPIRLASGATGWIASEFATLSGRVITTGPLRLRDSASTQGRILATLPEGTRATATGSATDASARTWLTIRLSSGATGWIAGWYVTP